MSNERDELAQIIMSPESFDGGPVSCGPNSVYAARIADAILAAGYRKPKVVTSVEELDALNWKSVILCKDPMTRAYVTPGHPVQSGAGYDCNCGQCLSVRAVLAERERELLGIKGPCSNAQCRLHYAHSGPCDCEVAS